MPNLNLAKFSGLDTLHTPAGIKDDKQSMLVNFDLTEQGYIRKRPGATRNTSIDDGEGLVILGRFKTVTYDRIIIYNGTDDDLMFCDPTGTGTMTDITSTANAGMCHAAQYGDIMYFCNFQANPQWYNGVGTPTDFVGKEVGTQNLFHKDREWIINAIAGAKWDNLRYSEIAGSTATNFDAGSHASINLIKVGSGDGHACTKLIVFNDNLYIFKTGNVWALFTDTNTPADWTLRQIEPTLGCTSKDGAVVHENLLYFLSLQGVYRTDGTTFEELSAPIRDFWQNRGLPTNGLWELNFYESMCVVGDKLFCFVRDELPVSAKDKNRTFVYNIKTKGWTEYVWELNGTSTPRTPVVIQDKSPVGMLFTGFSSVTNEHGYVYRWGDNDSYVDTADVARGYDSKFRTKLFDFGEPGTDKRMLNATVSYWTLNEDTTWTWRYEDGDSSAASILDPSNNLISLGTYPTEDRSRSLMPVRPAGWFTSVAGEFNDNGTADDSSDDVIIYGMTFNTTERKIAGRSINPEPT